MDQRKINKIINVVTILLIAALGVASFMVMDNTAKSNLVTADIAKIQSEHKTRVIQEVNLLSADVRNLGRDIDEIRKILKERENKPR